MYLLVDNYDSFTYNLYALCVKCGMNIKVIKNDIDISAEKFNGIIISPGPSNPENAGLSLKYIQKCSGKIPILGVCLGMQCIGYFLGFKIKHANTIKHGKVDRIKIIGDSVLFENIDDCFKSVRYHSLAVKVSKNSSLVKAVSISDREIMAIEAKEKMLFGVQFHPESYLSENGEQIIKNFKKFCERKRFSMKNLTMNNDI